MYVLATIANSTVLSNTDLLTEQTQTENKNKPEDFRGLNLLTNKTGLWNVFPLRLGSNLPLTTAISIKDFYSYLCTYDLYGPVRNAFPAARIKSITHKAVLIVGA
jgi:hypothetical protein